MILTDDETLTEQDCKRLDENLRSVRRACEAMRNINYHYVPHPDHIVLNTKTVTYSLSKRFDENY